MTEAEVVEMVNMHGSNAMTSITIYLTLTFAYLTAIHITGTKLSGVQTGFLALLYIVWASAFTLIAAQHMQSFESLVGQYPEFTRSPLSYLPWFYLSMAVCAGGILICIGFTYSKRSQAQQG